MRRLQVLVDPSFRSMGEIFAPADRAALDDIADVVWGKDEPMPQADFLAAAPDCDAIVFGGWRHGRAALDATSSLLAALLEVAGGHEHAGLDYRACLDRGIAVGSCAPAFAPVVAEMALALALDAMRGLSRADRRVRSADEAWLHAGNVGNQTLLGADVGFVGCGGISVHLQELLAPFGVSIAGYDPPMPDSALIERGIRVATLDEVMATSRVIFVLAAPTPVNQGLIGRRLLESLTPDQTLVLVSRASLVDFDAMTELAAAGRFRAGIDVYPHEPLALDHPIRRVENAVLVPHLAGALPDALFAIGRMVVEDLRAIAAEHQPTRMQYLRPDNVRGLLQSDPNESPPAT